MFGGIQMLGLLEPAPSSWKLTAVGEKGWGGGDQEKV